MTDELSGIKERLSGLNEMIGNTPMLEIFYSFKGGPERSIHVKCEHVNMSGSIKDRLALYLLQKAYDLGTIHPDDTIVEVSSGNSGKSFVTLARALGHPVRVMVADWVESEWLDILSGLGADVQVLSSARGEYARAVILAEKDLLKSQVFLTRQLKAVYHTEVHEKRTGVEIWQQLRSENKVPRAFVAAVGTGGTVLGVGQYLKTVYPAIHIHPLELVECCQTIDGKERHLIRGICDETIRFQINLSLLDKIVTVSEQDALMTTCKIGRELGIFVGASSGANLLAAIKLQQATGSKDAIVTVFPGANRPGLDLNSMPNGDGLSAAIRFTGYRTIAKTRNNWL